jgi:hypothetical protein
MLKSFTASASSLGSTIVSQASDMLDLNCAPRPNPESFVPRAGSVLEQTWKRPVKVSSGDGSAAAPAS